MMKRLTKKIVALAAVLLIPGCASYGGGSSSISRNYYTTYDEAGKVSGTAKSWGDRYVDFYDDDGDFVGSARQD